MSSDWRSYQLSEFGRIVTGKTPRGDQPELFNGGVPFVTPPDFAGQKWITGTVRTVSELGAQTVKGSIIPPESVLVTCIGSDMGKAAIASARCLANQQINAVVVDKARFSPEFLFYSLSLRKAEIRGIAGGSAQPILNKAAFGQIQVSCPSRREQQRIVDLLCPLDDRIALLRETNATLEAIAQALFKSWFVDFDPIRAKNQGLVPVGIDEATAAAFPHQFEESKCGWLPAGWSVEPLGDWLSVLESGRRPKGGVSGIQEGVPSIGAESIVRIGQFDFGKTKFISRDFFSSMSAGVLQSHDVLLYKDGGKPGVFLPRVSMFGDGFPFELCTINEHVFRLRARRPMGQTFLYFMVWSDSVMHELKHRGGKAAIPGINQTDVREIKVLIPGEAILRKYEELTAPLVASIFNNAKRARSLITLRDTLLPRLISGQLRLTVAEAALETA